MAAAVGPGQWRFGVRLPVLPRDHRAERLRFRLPQDDRLAAPQRTPAADERRHALAFLGTGTVNDNHTGAYGPDNPPRGTAMGSMGDAPVNSAGRLLRIGEGELLMILDFDERGFELYHLKR